MKVFNLTQTPLEFHGFTIPPNGGWREIPAMDVFVSDRDLEMARRGVISFTNTPPGWHPAGEAKTRTTKAVSAPAPRVVTLPLTFSMPELDVKQDDGKKKWKKTE